MNPLIQRREPDRSLELPGGLHPLVRRVLLRRPLQSVDELDLSLKNLLSPDGLLGAGDAVDLLVRHLQKQSRILVVSDFDADGATSCALSLRALRSLGFENLDYIVPNRFEYGYGLTPEIVQLAATRDPDLIITVDNGISSLDGVESARQAGIEVLITDHHLPGAALPRAEAIVNPNQPGCRFASKSLAGVGVIFYLMLALRTRLRTEGWFTGKGLKEPNLGELLDLVALGTVADVVPLDFNNRILVNEGLRRIRAGRACPGIQALLQVSRRTGRNLVAGDLGFAIGPRLNAAGRLDDMSLGIECLLTESTDAAYRMAVQLDGLNSDRRLIEAEMRDQAFNNLADLELGDEQLPAGLCVYRKDWHQGVIGILASRIKDKYHRPVIAFADAGTADSESEAQLKGSARSIAGFHIRDALDAIASRNPGLISKFGGHAMAAGLSLDRDKLEAFSQAFDSYAAQALDEDALQARILTDGELEAGEFDLSAAEALAAAGPWGQGFPEPVFDGEFAVQDLRVLADKHLKLSVLPADGHAAVEAIAFNADLSLGLKPGDIVALVYRLGVNEFRDSRRVQLVVEQLRLA